MSSVGAKVDQELDPVPRINYAECEKSIKDLLAQTPNPCTQLAFGILGGIMAGVCLASIPAISVHPIIGGVIAVVSAIVAAVGFARFCKAENTQAELEIDRKVNAIFFKVMMSGGGIATPEILAFLDKNGHLCTHLYFNNTKPGVTISRFCKWALDGGLKEHLTSQVVKERLETLQNVPRVQSMDNLLKIELAIRIANHMLNKNPPPQTKERDEALKKINDACFSPGESAIVRKDLYQFLKRLPNLTMFSASFILPEDAYKFMEAKRSRMTLCTIFGPNDLMGSDTLLSGFPGLDDSETSNKHLISTTTCITPGQ